MAVPGKPAKRCRFEGTTVGIQMQREFVAKNLNEALSFVNLSNGKGTGCFDLPSFTIFFFRSIENSKEELER